MGTISHKTVGLERMLDYRGACSVKFESASPHMDPVQKSVAL